MPSGQQQEEFHKEFQKFMINSGAPTKFGSNRKRDIHDLPEMAVL
jgi:hypothetical protein